MNLHNTFYFLNSSSMLFVIRVESRYFKLDTSFIYFKDLPVPSITDWLISVGKVNKTMLFTVTFPSRYKISREKLEPEPGFEPRTSGFLARRSATWAILRSYNVKFPKAQTMGLVSINSFTYNITSSRTEIHETHYLQVMFNSFLGPQSYGLSYTALNPYCGTRCWFKYRWGSNYNQWMGSVPTHNREELGILWFVATILV